MGWALAYDLSDGIYKDTKTISGAAPDAAADRKCAAMALYCMSLKLGAALPSVNPPVDFSDAKDIYGNIRLPSPHCSMPGSCPGCLTVPMVSTIL